MIKMKSGSPKMIFRCVMSLACLAIVGCGGESSIPKPEVSAFVRDVDIVRFDRILAEVDTNNMSQEVLEVREANTAIFDLYFEQLIPISKPDSLNLPMIKDFLTNGKVRYMLDTIAEIFPNLRKEEKELSSAFAYMQYYFPGKEVPRLYALYGDFTYQAFLFDDEGRDAIGVDLDMFLGAQFPYKEIDIQNPIFSDYIARRYDRKYLSKKVMEVQVEELLGPMSGKRLIDHAIYQGKKLNILQHLMPDTEINILMEYTAPEMDWCETNQLQMWDFFLDKELFFETNQQKINSYVNEAPTSVGMPKESPGRTAHYLGYNIVKAYLAKTGASISDLILEKDSEKIFQDSKYKPKRN